MNFSSYNKNALFSEHTMESSDPEFAYTDGLRLNYARTSSMATPLLLFHGVLRQWRDFTPILAPLSAHWRTIAMDFRGHGRSGKAAGQYLVGDYVRDAVDLLNSLEEDSAVLYGHSLGAMVALAAAAEKPEKVRGLVLEDPPFDTMGVRIQQTPFHLYFQGLQKLLGTTDNVSELARALAELPVKAAGQSEPQRLGDVRDWTSLRFSARCLVDVDPQVMTPIVSGRWLAGYDYREMLRGIRCPTLLLQGDPETGGMLTDEDAHEVETRIPDCYRVKIPRSGHLLHWRNADEVLRLTTGFVESLRW